MGEDRRRRLVHIAETKIDSRQVRMLAEGLGEAAGIMIGLREAPGFFVQDDRRPLEPNLYAEWFSRHWKAVCIAA